MKSMKKGKLSGFDGLPIQYFDRFIDILAPFLTKVYLEAFDSETLPDTFNEALISLILKKDGDATDPSSYRPVSLLNVDYKILTKIMALRLDKVLPEIIQADQVGVVKGRSSTDNLRRLLHLTWQNTSNNTPTAAISLDAEKAFYRVEWSFLAATMSHLGFGSNFRTWIQILY